MSLINVSYKVDFFPKLLDLYSRINKAMQVKCKEGCNSCCSENMIWLTLPELIILNAKGVRKDHKYGCPYRTETGCSNYLHRPLVCRSFGAIQLVHKKVNNLFVNLSGKDFIVAGPGICSEVFESSCQVDDLNQIYTEYGELLKFGLVCIGSNKDKKTHARVEFICEQLQANNLVYKVWSKDGTPDVDIRIMDRILDAIKAHEL